MVDEYMKLHPNVKVHLYNIPYGERETKVPSAIETGELPDILRADYNYQYYLAYRNVLLPLDDYLKGWEMKDAIFKPLWNEVTIGGHIVAIPQDAFTNNLFYNRDLVKKAGLEDPIELYKKGQWTWEKFIEYSKKLTKPDEKQYGFAFRGKGPMFEFPPVLYTVSGLGSKGHLAFFDFQTKQVSVNNEAGVKALTLFVDLTKQGVMPPEVMSWGWDEVTSAFKAGKLAMYSNGYWEEGNLRLAGIKFERNYVPWPSINGKQGGIVYTCFYAVMKSSKHPQEAADLLKFIVSKENAKRWAKTLGHEPIDSFTAADPQVGMDPLYDASKGTMKYAGIQPPTPLWWPINKAMEDAIQNVLLGKQTPKAALDGAAKVIQEELKRVR
jgi:multiple sugar transport system substrate-binding protein